MILPLFPLNFPINCFCFRIRSSSGGSRNKSAAKEDRMLDCLLRGRPTVIRVCVTPSSVAVIYCLHFHRVALFPIKWHRPVRLWIYYIDAIDSAPDDGWHSASISIPSFRPPFPFLLFFFLIIPRTFTGGAADWTMHLARAFHFAPADSITARHGRKWSHSDKLCAVNDVRPVEATNGKHIT